MYGKGILTAAGLDSVTTLPDHGADWARVHVYRMLVHHAYVCINGRYLTLNEASEEWLGREVRV
jgi:hypothetical protein